MFRLLNSAGLVAVLLSLNIVRAILMTCPMLTSPILCATTPSKVDRPHCQFLVSASSSNTVLMKGAKMAVSAINDLAIPELLF